MKKCNIWYLTFVVFLLVSCGTIKPATAPEEATREAATPEQGGIARVRPRTLNPDELAVVFPAGDLELDFRRSFISSEAQIFTALYEGLFSYHPFTMEAVPGVAVRWELSEDRRQWTFILRSDARYSNGDLVVAEHFRSAWLSLLDPAKEAPYASLFDIIEGARDFRLGNNRDPNSVAVTARDDHTLIVRLNHPAPFFRSMLCHHAFSPIHPSMLDNPDWSSPVSNGAFYISSHDEFEMVLNKNPYYWDEANVSLSRLILVFADDAEDATELWNSGDVRWITGGMAHLDKLTDRSGIRIDPLFATHYYFIRSEEAPWSDHRVSRALALALQWEELRAGYHLPAETLIYPLWGYPRVTGISTGDIETAVSLLASAGFPMGEGLPPLVIRLTPSYDARRIGLLMASAWTKLGIQVQIETVPFAEYFQSLREGGYVVGSSTWIGDFADPYTFLHMWRQASTLNDAHHTDEEFERLMERSMSEEGERRMATLAEAEHILLYNGTVLPIAHSLAINIISMDEIEGWFPNALGIHPFKYLAFRRFSPLPYVAAR